MYRENPNDYSREERLNSTWWGSRKGRGVRQSVNLKRNRRITLIDMLLLLVAAGVLVPWFLTMDRGIEVGIFTVDLDVRDRKEDTLLRIEFTLSDDSVPSGDSRVGWRLVDGGGKIVYEDFDLPPAPGNSRIFRYIGEIGEEYSVEFHGGEVKQVISPVE